MVKVLQIISLGGKAFFFFFFLPPKPLMNVKWNWEVKFKQVNGRILTLKNVYFKESPL